MKHASAGGLFLIVLFFRLSTPCESASVSGADFLLLPPHAAEAALSGAFGASGGGVSSVEYNPAGLAWKGENGIVISHQSMKDYFDLESLGFIFGKSRFGTGGSILYFHSPFTVIREGVERESMSVQFVSVSMGAGMPVLGFEAGAAVRFVHQNLAGNTAWTVGFSGGVIRRFVSPIGWSAGVYVKNFGPGVKFVSVADPLPSAAGGGFSLPVRTLTLAVAAEWYPYQKAYEVKAGLEWKLWNLIAVRLSDGWDGEYHAPAAGFGLSIIRSGWRMGFDYGIVFQPGEAVMHGFSLSAGSEIGQ